MNDDLAFAGPAELGRLVRSGQATPRELVELFLARVEALDPRLNAFRTTLAEQALAQADASVGADGALAGVPVAIKDDWLSPATWPRAACAARTGPSRPRVTPRRCAACARPARSRSGSPTSPS